MGDSLIGRTAGFDPVSPGSSPGPPAKYKFIYMKIILFYFILLLLLLVSKTTLSSQYTYIKIFKETLSSYNITFEDLEIKNLAQYVCQMMIINILNMLLGLVMTCMKKKS